MAEPTFRVVIYGGCWKCHSHWSIRRRVEYGHMTGEECWIGGCSSRGRRRA